jgi:recombination protein RecT
MSETKQTKQVAKVEESMAQRFTNKVMSLFGTTVGDINLTKFQQRLAQNYFMSIDASLRAAEEKRIKGNSGKEERYQNLLPYTWTNVDMELLSQSVVAAARTGLDPAQKNHISMIPFKNGNKYGIGFIEGYRGIELKAKKYGLDIPDAVIVELVYSTDKFKAIKKDRNNRIESYEFEVTNEFNRGEIVGGFYYHVYSNNQEKNKLVMFTYADILKRKPKYASAEFWGGEKDIWKDKKVVGKEKIDGWHDMMCHKTLHRAAYSNITIDSQKIDTDYLALNQLEQQMNDATVYAEIAEHANSEVIDVTPEEACDAEIAEIFPADEVKAKPNF